VRGRQKGCPNGTNKKDGMFGKVVGTIGGNAPCRQKDKGGDNVEKKKSRKEGTAIRDGRVRPLGVDKDVGH